MLRSISLGAAIALCCGSALAGQSKWPKPAAGVSASGGPEVIFTFDDGPHETYTPLILDALRDHGMHAIFFWVGHRISRPSRGLPDRLAVVRRAVAEGHLIGNHTVNHAHLCLIKPADGAQEIDRSASLLTAAAGMPPMLFRTPYGSRCRRVLALLDERKLDHMHWDIDPHEWEYQDSKVAAANVIARLRRLEGRAVLLMHDTKAVTARAMPLILDWIVAENRRRVARGARPIRVLSFADLAREQLAPGLLEWSDEIRRDLQGRGRAVADLLPGRAGTKLSRR